MQKPELRITVFSDYICPFCYVGYKRLMKLSDTCDIRINWCFLEIHPETSEEGEAIASLDYPSETWKSMMQGLDKIAQEENIKLKEIRFITNSRNALRLSEAAKLAGKEVFYALHDAIFNAYFVLGKNIADKEFLQQLGEQCGMNKQAIYTAWTDENISRRLQENYQAARGYGIQSVPSFIFGDKILTGVVSENHFRQVAQNVLNTGT